ncbi:hypothetical protein HGRIS_012156 [Hohenbuehelia grisea]|uniref:WD40 repeat-like protein n=1 Tax=Hohenbuehelia grisea TaxID=104357 RepID=A0ABR3IRG3_9AGAR
MVAVMQGEEEHWPPDESLIIGVRGACEAAAFSPDGKHIVSGSNDTTIRIWDTESGQQVGDALSGHTGWVRSVAFSPDGKHIVSGSDDTTIRIWDTESGQQVGDALSGHTGWVRSVAFSPDGKHIVSGSDDTTIRIWDTESGQQVGDALSGHTGWVRSVAFSPNGKHIVSGSDDTAVRILDSQRFTAHQFHTSDAHAGNALRLAGPWFYHDCDNSSTPVLWVPHIFRTHDWCLYPCTTVLSSRPKASLSRPYPEILHDWRKIQHS